MEIRFIENSEIYTIVPLLMLLNPSIPEEIINHRLQEMLNRGYRCAGVYQAGELIAICGLWDLVKIYAGRHIEPDNVFVRPEYRSTGIGKMLIEWVLNYAREIGCEASELNCYLANKSGQKFWENEGFVAIGLHYQLKM